MPPLPPAVQLTPEQQREAVGKETSEKETFSEESEPVPRLYNAPLEPTFPGFFVLPGTQTMLRINGNLKTDFMFDPRPAGFADSFIPSTIPIPQASSTNNFNASIRESRFSADFRIPVSNIGTATDIHTVRFLWFQWGDDAAAAPFLCARFTTFWWARRIPFSWTRTRGRTLSNFRDPPLAFSLVPRRFDLASRWDTASAVRSLWSSRIPISPFPWMALRLSRSLPLRTEDSIYATKRLRGHFYLSTILRELAVQAAQWRPAGVRLWMGPEFVEYLACRRQGHSELSGCLRQWDLKVCGRHGGPWPGRSPKSG